MKKYLIFSGIVTAALLFANCNPGKKATATEPPKEVPKSTYAANVTTVITNHCTPCHIPAKGGNKKSYDNFANVRSDIDEIIRRIELNPGDRGFMPFKHPKLSDSTITVFKQWKADGMLEN
jgi:hypothetical protein